MGPVLQIDRLSRRFSDVLAVDRVSLTLEPGEILTLLGPNGAGKTTLMRMICGLLRPDAGSLRLLGASGAQLQRVRRRALGYCPQALVVWRALSCLEQLVLLGRMHGASRRRARARAGELLARFGLEHKAHRRAGQLSGGTQRRLNIALALVHDPELLVLDEPAAGLDAESRVRLREVLGALAHEAGKSVLVSTHDIDQAERLADRVAVMDGGRLVAVDAPAALRGERETLEQAVLELTGREGAARALPRDWQSSGWGRA